MELDEVSNVRDKTKFGRALHIQCAGFEYVVGERTEEGGIWPDLAHSSLVLLDESFGLLSDFEVTYLFTFYLIICFLLPYLQISRDP
ncbi:hypothetical protein RchiOBHm_Chr3g0496711 [Rosa chinensis]|uniref:Uncharacterized protein n=1 Tax=Rosa chinensis TaxID=74649 RepID=A0A2P6RHL2_ROSCH|nr:hypothetical protein RchiOBHm_Chr3g0496711 [Rosa chinensis]